MSFGAFGGIKKDRQPTPSRDLERSLKLFGWLQRYLAEFPKLRGDCHFSAGHVRSHIHPQVDGLLDGLEAGADRFPVRDLHARVDADQQLGADRAAGSKFIEVPTFAACSGFYSQIIHLILPFSIPPLVSDLVEGGSWRYSCGISLHSSGQILLHFFYLSILLCKVFLEKILTISLQFSSIGVRG